MRLLIDILTWVFIGIFLIDMMFKPMLDRTSEGDVLLWYTGIKSKKRKNVKLL